MVSFIFQDGFFLILPRIILEELFALHDGLSGKVLLTPTFRYKCQQFRLVKRLLD